MCGFAGIVNFSGVNNCEDRVLKLMGDALRFRGPDEETQYKDGNLAFVFRRLSIVDVKGGTQPIWNEDKSIFVSINGEIYNHLELRAELKEEHVFTTNSDSEIVLHLYEEIGVKAFEKLNGMFAITLWDCTKKELVLCRDRLGIKPLYIAETSEGYLFGSELKAILQHPACPNDISWSDLKIPGLQDKKNISSYVDGIQHFPAGHYLTISYDKCEYKKYWTISDYIEKSIKPTESDIKKTYNDLICDSVDKRLMADVPLGVFFSGGLDSSLIAAIASEISTDIHCFTVIDKATYSSGDVDIAKNLADHYGFKFYPILFNSDDLIAKFDLKKLETMIYLMESPRFDLEWYYKSELHKAAKKYVPKLKVILLGQGADEFAGGYSKYLGSSWNDWQEYIEGNVNPAIKARSNRLAGIPERFDRYFESPNNVKLSKDNAYKKKMEAFVSQLQFFNLWHEDRTSSYYGVEARVPFLDHRIVEFLASLSSDLHEKLFWNKSLIRKVVKEKIDIYPEAHDKVPFFVTNDQSSLNIVAKSICKNVFNDFSESYLNTTNLPISNGAFHELYELSQKKNIRNSEYSWQLIELMSIVIFAKFCKSPDYFLKISSNSVADAYPVYDVSEWDKLQEVFNSSQYLKDVSDWKLETKLNIPEDCEIVNLLTEGDSFTELVWLSERAEVLRIKVPISHDWLVQLLDEMGRHIDSPKDLRYWSDKTGVAPQMLINSLNRFVTEGYITKI